jgi:hypothetical protein
MRAHAGSILVGSGPRCSDEGGVAALDRLLDPGAAVGRVVAAAVLDLLGLDRQRLVLTALAPRPRATFDTSVSTHEVGLGQAPAAFS